MAIRLGTNPIAWSNDDLHELASQGVDLVLSTAFGSSIPTDDCNGWAGSTTR